MGLSCELSPLVFAELYRKLASEGSCAELLEERLAEVGWELSWLDEAAQRYEATWQGSLKVAAGPGDLVAVGAEHAVLASWVLAALRGSGSSYDFGDELRVAVTTRALAEIPSAPMELPNQWKPVVVGWTLGMVVGAVDQNLPVAPARLPTDDNVRAAYEGLVEHVLHLNDVPAPWPEMAGTSTFWRGTGLAEGMQPEAADGQQAITQLVIEVRRIVPEHMGRQIGQHFTQFAERRNTLSHVADKPGKPRFVDVKEQARDWSQIRLTIMGITQFLCSQIALELTESAGRVVREGTWDDLKWELIAFDD
ncbi:hypothetical protein JOE61_004102 [Nocardioides salarius]|uniref:Apea-like HEPN domain-containing protein n=1 Tax=Nocardioides salarius TaxID=374513 RepID=A0ABS2MGI4_9ACTN|nr:hypothetical protein [Nocardioides salarius]MBM7510288.1 hypothetical protein [Nocardioides salarius]